MVTPASTNAGPPSGDFVLALDCPDRPGIVHAVTGAVADAQGNITELQQFSADSGRFFMRLQVEAPGERAAFEAYLETIPPSKRFDRALFYDLRDAVGKSGFGIGSAGLPA